MEIFVAEVFGTAMLLTLGNGVVANHVLSKTKGNNTGWMLITTGWGLAVALSIYAVARISGAHLNPAVTIGLYSIGELEANQVPIYLGAEMLGAFIGAVIVWASYISHWSQTDDADAKLAVFCTAPAIRSTIPNFLCEVVGTALLVFGILGIAANGSELDGDTIDLFGAGMKPLLVGLLVWSIDMSMGGPTGYAINPARDLGPRIAHFLLPIPGKRNSDWGYAWIPVLGPITGGVAGAFLFKFLDSYAT